jgi:hypothetical protein
MTQQTLQRRKKENIMPKAKVYEHDYEWTGQENKPKGVNLQEKNPWNKPDWGVKPVCQSGPTSSYDLHPDRFDMDELQRRHQWEKPNWATVKGNTVGNKDVITDPIPKPMLKKLSVGGSPGDNGLTSTATGSSSKSKTPDEVNNEIADIERRIEDARQNKAALEKQKEEDEKRLKHTVEESKLEKARRLAKEREDARWRATLVERNQRDKEKREQARLAALQQSNLAASTSDSMWQKSHDEQEHRYQERVQMEAIKRQTADDQGSFNEAKEDVKEVEEGYTEDLNSNVVVDNSVTDIAPTIDALQSQIDELRRQLEMA